MRAIVRTKSYYNRNSFVCHLEQKQMYWQNKSEQRSEQVSYSPNKILVARTTYYSSQNKFISHLEQ
jgi:hypothetical protein